jgi:hypothetical protein
MDRSDAVAMETVREIPQQGVVGIGCHILDHQPVSSHAERQCVSSLQQRAHPAGESVG